MMFVLYLVGVILFLGLCVMIVSIKNAPRGYEDESGFHEVQSTKPAPSREKVAAPEGVVSKPLATANVP